MSKVYNPVSTYRIQFNKEFNFDDFENMIGYLSALGVNTIYASPIFTAAPGSTHGYDGTNPNEINPEIGSLQQLKRISSKLKELNISWLQDIVPNHLSYHQNNSWLMDVLEKGQSSPYASFFDIDWNHPHYPGRLMVPFPGSELEDTLKKKFPGEKNHVLCSWQETDYRLNYRRFFLVNTLICTNIHLPEVFGEYHRLIKDLVDANIFQGLRIDHVDGLYDPTNYLHKLRDLAGEDVYIIVEKILEPGEQMPLQWPIQGNSGYDFLGFVNNLFSNRDAENHLTAFYDDVTGNNVPIKQQVHQKKEMILHWHMGGELDNLVRLYRKVAGVTTAQTSDEELKKDISAYLVNCPVYRYYDDIPLMDRDHKRNKEEMKTFYQRCMQFTGPLMAKGVEDTLMYTYNRFIGHNEVGDSPEFFGFTAGQFHKLMKNRRLHWPLALNASSTHDTKRGEDVRARLNALTDLHEEWIRDVTSWIQLNSSHKKGNAPDRNDEYFIYQTIAGSYPMIPPSGIDSPEVMSYSYRLKEYLEKSMREAKVHSTWTETNEDYETATISFAQSLIEPRGKFLQVFTPFFQKICDYGMLISLSQTVLKFTCPGIPDVYQGTELWDLSLVDPDNRRPVDYSLRQRMLKENGSLRELWNSRWNGQIKLQLLHELQTIRTSYANVFSEGDYEAVPVSGRYSENVLAFTRTLGSQCLLVAVPLHYAHVRTYSQDATLLDADWNNTSLAIPGKEGEWNNLLTSEKMNATGEMQLNQLFGSFPIALFYRE